jgi:26S proteasome non-ATPase regulatory subunit 10
MDEGGMSPLMSAASGGHAAACALLLQHGASAGLQSEEGRTALHYHKGRAAIVELLAPVSPNVSQGDALGCTPLHRAAGPGHLDAARALIAAGAKLDAKDCRGCTPLHCACEEDREHVALLLVSEGASLQLLNEDKKSPLMLAQPGLRAKLTAAHREL